MINARGRLAENNFQEGGGRSGAVQGLRQLQEPRGLKYWGIKPKTVKSSPPLALLV